MFMENLSAEQREAVLKEVGYTEKQLEADIVTIREWLERQHHLPPSRLKESDNFLAFYLTGCKGSLEKTKQKLDQYYTFRSHTEILECRDPTEPEYSAFLKVPNYGLIPKPMGVRNPARVVYTDLSEVEPEKFNFLLMIRLVCSLNEIRVREDTVSTRTVVVLNSKGFSAAHMMKLKPVIMRDYIRLMLDIFPLRYAKFIFINVHSVMDTVLNTFFSPFLSSKLKERLVVTSGGYEEVYKYLDKSYIPKDWGGDGPTFKEMKDRSREAELERRDWYLNELSERCDESKRTLEEGALANPYFGVPGSLKKLVVD